MPLKKAIKHCLININFLLKINSDLDLDFYRCIVCVHDKVGRYFDDCFMKLKLNEMVIKLGF